MGTGRTLNKDPRTRPIKSQGEKRRRSKAQRARLVKLGMSADVVAKMQPDEVHKLVQRPVDVKKMLGLIPSKPAKSAKPAKAEVAAESAAPAKKPAAKKPAAKKPAAKKAPQAE